MGNGNAWNCWPCWPRICHCSNPRTLEEILDRERERCIIKPGPVFMPSHRIEGEGK